jgi:hypothetical protein
MEFSKKTLYSAWREGIYLPDTFALQQKHGLVGSSEWEKLER